MAVQTLETRLSERKPFFPWISWGAVFGGLASGMATFILLALLGLAAGFTAVDPQASEPVGTVPLWTGLWTGISMLLSAFVGGYVAARISGLSRRSDGIFHGFVVWGVSTLLFAFLVTTSVGNLLGGVFNIVGQGMQATMGAVTGVAGETAGSPNVRGQMESLISGSAGMEISQESFDRLQQRLQAGDRQGAINVMVNEMGFTPDRAETLVDPALSLYGSVQQLPPGEEVAETAISALTTAAWWLFAGILLSLILGVAGGATGARGVGKRRTAIAH